MFDATPLIFPQLGPVYQALLPWTEALLRAVVGLSLVPHGLRSTFGMFPSTGAQSHNLTEFADELDRGGYHPGRFWACAIVLTQLGRSDARAWTIHASRCLADLRFSDGDKLRTLASGRIFLDQHGS